MKKLANLTGVKLLSKAAQKTINGGGCNPCAGKPQGAKCYVGCDPGNVGRCDILGGGPPFCAAF
ncbi:hypothetical protein [Flagellimonas pacifica]|uniref:Uncharacterized protein n=1 Tax=Flagellimonas pacifica TaxID=1247520 RepID=A0A285MSG5_9FLAO|nr:hypothetical protein [Allomuricauda parva]SNZ00115.1 hypothetical protein SAMN06265377_1932 [Allomuricauda parva]